MTGAAATGRPELHEELQVLARRLVGRPVSSLGGPHPPALAWAALGEAGLLDLEVPEALGGGGATFAETAVVLHELGRAPAVGPYLGSVVLAVAALSAVAANDRRDEVLGRLGAGEVTVATVLASGPEGGGAPPFSVGGTPGRPVVSGTAVLVPDVPGADRLLVLAGDGRGRPVLVELDPAAPGLTVEPRPVVDATRQLGTVTADGVAVDPGARWPVLGDPADAVAALFDRAATAVACDSLGLCEALLEATVAYVGVREQFGRPVGSFQAVKHACADMVVALSVGRELVADAVAAVASAGSAPGAAAGAPAAGARSCSASMAKSGVCAAAVAVAGKAMQLHGGIGYTWDSGIHAYLKRATLNASLFGSGSFHRRRVAARYRREPAGGPPGPERTGSGPLTPQGASPKGR